jgi:hypothetical protein
MAEVLSNLGNFFLIESSHRGGEPEPIGSILARALPKVFKLSKKKSRCPWLNGKASTLPAGPSAVEGRIYGQPTITNSK